MKAHAYNEDYIYYGDVDCQEDILGGSYLIPAMATLTDLLPYNINNEYLYYHTNNSTWEVMQIQITGDYYLKSNGEYSSLINKKDISLYTEIAISLNNGDVVHFDDNSQKWVYDIKGPTTIANELASAKIVKLSNINNNYINSYQIGEVAGQYSSKLALHGDMFIDFTNTISKSLSNGFSAITLSDNNGVTYGALCPHIFLAEIYWEFSRIGGSNSLYYLTVSKLVNECTTIEQIDAINPIIVDYVNNIDATNNKFINNTQINVNTLIDELTMMTDEQLAAEDYTVYHINNYRTWVSSLQKDAQNNYIIAQY